MAANLEKIVLIQLDPEIPNLRDAIHFPRFGITAIHSILRNLGYNVVTFVESMYGKLDLDTVLNENPDLVMFNGIACTTDKNREFANELKRHDIRIVTGGEYATLNSDDVKDFSDFIVIGEGDETVPQLVSALTNGYSEEDLERIRGILFKTEKGWAKTAKARRVEDISFRLNLEGFRGVSNVTERYRNTMWPIQASRSCPHNCTFCSASVLFGDRKYILRPVENILEDIRLVWSSARINRFIFVDNLFGADPEHTRTLLRGIKKLQEEVEKPYLYVLCRADQYTGTSPLIDDSQLNLMAEAGIREIALGMESVNATSLKLIRKASDLDIYKEAVQRIKLREIFTRSTFIGGLQEDTVDDIIRAAEFATSIGCDTMQLYALGFIPGTTDFALNMHRIIPGFPLKYLNGHSVTAFSKRATPYQVQEAIIKGTRIFYKNKNDALARLTLRAYERVFTGLEPLRDSFQRMDNYLFSRGIYTKLGDQIVLNEDQLRVLSSPENHPHFRDEISSFFN